MKRFLRAFAIAGIIIGTLSAVLGFLAFMAGADRNGTFFVLGVSAVVQSVLILGFVRIIDLLEELNVKLEPVERLAAILAARHLDQKQPTSNSGGRPKASVAPLNDQDISRPKPTFRDASSFPRGTTVYSVRGIQVAVLPDQSVIVDQAGAEVAFETVVEYREHTKDRESWTILREY